MAFPKKSKGYLRSCPEMGQFGLLRKNRGKLPHGEKPKKQRFSHILRFPARTGRTEKMEFRDSF